MKIMNPNRVDFVGLSSFGLVHCSVWLHISGDSNFLAELEVSFLLRGVKTSDIFPNGGSS